MPLSMLSITHLSKILSILSHLQHGTIQSWWSLYTEEYSSDHPKFTSVYISKHITEYGPQYKLKNLTGILWSIFSCIVLSALSSILLSICSSMLLIVLCGILHNCFSVRSQESFQETPRCSSKHTPKYTFQYTSKCPSKVLSCTLPCTLWTILPSKVSSVLCSTLWCMYPTALDGTHQVYLALHFKLDMQMGKILPFSDPYIV